MNEEDYEEREIRKIELAYDYETKKKAGIEIDKRCPSRNYSMYVNDALRELIEEGNHSPSFDELVEKTKEIGDKKTEEWVKLGYDDG